EFRGGSDGIRADGRRGRRRRCPPWRECRGAVGGAGVVGTGGEEQRQGGESRERGEEARAGGMHVGRGRVAGGVGTGEREGKEVPRAEGERRAARVPVRGTSSPCGPRALTPRPSPASRARGDW